jgi:hypothetical protein
MVIVLAIGASVISTAMYALHTLLNVQNTAVRVFAESATTSRIGELFRRDAHAARTADLSGSQDAAETQALRLASSADREVLWTWQDDKLTRQTMQGGEREQTEQFRIPRGSTVRFATDGEICILTLTRLQTTSLKNRPAAGGQAARVIQVEAQLGRDALSVGTNSE